MIKNPKRKILETRGWTAKIHNQLTRHLKQLGNFNTLMPIVDYANTKGERYIINVSEGLNNNLDFDFIKISGAKGAPVGFINNCIRLDLPISIIKNIVRAFDQEEKDGNC